MHRNNGTNHNYTLADKHVYARFSNNPLAMYWHNKLLSMSWQSSTNHMAQIEKAIRCFSGWLGLVSHYPPKQLSENFIKRRFQL